MTLALNTRIFWNKIDCLSCRDTKAFVFFFLQQILQKSFAILSEEFSFVPAQSRAARRGGRSVPGSRGTCFFFFYFRRRVYTRADFNATQIRIRANGAYEQFADVDLCSEKLK